MIFDALLKDSGVLSLKEAIPESSNALRIVGGAVRDFIHEEGMVSTFDIDFSTTYEPQEIQFFLSKAGIKTKNYALKFGTVVALINSRAYEITSCRKDISTDGRWAKVEYTKDWSKDAVRRDFTFNAMYLSLSGELFDFFDGRNDLRNGVVRFIGDPESRLEEDYLRLLRYYRFWGRFSKYDHDVNLRNLFTKLVPNIRNLSADRIRNELLLIAALPYDKFQNIVNELSQIGFFHHVMKCIPSLSEYNSSNMSSMGRLFVMYINKIDDLSISLNLSKKDKIYLRALHDAYNKNLPCLATMAEYGYDVCRDLQAMRGESIEEAQRKTPNFPLTASDIIAKGVTGASIGLFLKEARQFWLRSNCTASYEECLDFICKKL